MKKIDINAFKVKAPIQLNQLKSTYDLGVSKKHIENEMARVRKRLGKLQDTMYAHGKYAVLVCLQGHGYCRKRQFDSRGI